jgi:nitrite reductase/ring-hydroxylating ferredoxin subunit/uncharacterized membrane protein
MRSKASIKGHPLHPMLIAFPVAFFAGTFIFDALSVICNNDDFWRTAAHLEIAGVVSAVFAAVPGLVDFFGTVPPKSSAKKRGARHGLLNTLHVLIFLAAWFTRDDLHKMLVLGMELAGVIILSIAGWLGGTLVYRNQIGVDARYANKGRWNEIHLKSSQDPIEVATQSELQPNQMKLLHIGGKRIVLGRTEDEYVAFDDHCTHRGGSLAGGTMICGTVQCPWHGSQFDVKTGEVKCGPAAKKINTYEVYERDGKIWLSVH